MITFQIQNDRGDNITVQVTDDGKYHVNGTFTVSPLDRLSEQFAGKPSIFGPSGPQQVKSEPAKGLMRGRLPKIPQVRSASGHK